MSPHAVNSFVTDLVAMAQAMDKLPLVEAQLLDKYNEVVDWQRRYVELTASLEQSRAYAASIEQKLHNAEVARDDAELRFLELDEKASQAMVRLTTISIDLAASVDDINKVKAVLDPPKAETPPVTVPITEQGQSASGPTVNATPTAKSESATSSETNSNASTSGQSEPLPTATLTENQSIFAPSTVENMDTVVASEPTALPYSGLRYYDYPSWVSLEAWLAGGGTQENYDWRPNRVSHW